MSNIGAKPVPPAMTKATPVFPTVAQAMATVDSWASLSERRRRDYRAALAAVATSFGAPPQAVRLDPAQLERRFLRASPACLGIKPSTLIAYRSLVRAVLRRLGLLAHPAARGLTLSPAWAALLEACPDKYQGVRLRRFMAHCTAHGIEPQQVTNATLAAFLEATKAERLIRNPFDTVRRVASAWNLAVRNVAGWPQTPLQAPSAETRQYTLPFSAYPTPLQQEIEQARQRMSPAASDSLYTAAGPIRPLKPRTVETRMTSLRLILGAAVHCGLPKDELTSLNLLVEPATLKAILDWFWRRAGRNVTDHTGQIGETLRIVAKYHLGISGQRLDEITRLCRAAKPPKRSRMTPKNERRLATLEDPRVFACLLHLPAVVMAEANALLEAGDKQEAAWLAGIAAAIEIELRCPMRCENLTHLRLGEQVVQFSGSQRFSHFLVGGDEVKNETPITWPIAADTSALLDAYCRKFRPLLKHAGTSWLFPNRDYADRPRAPGGLSASISAAIHKYIGVEMNLHLFRAFAGAQILAENPGALEDLRLVLGHRGLETALNYYTTFQPKAAAQRLNALTTRKRVETRSLAAAAFARQGLRLPPRRRA